MNPRRHYQRTISQPSAYKHQVHSTQEIQYLAITGSKRTAYLAEQLAIDQHRRYRSSPRDQGTTLIENAQQNNFKRSGDIYHFHKKKTTDEEKQAA